MTGKMYKYSPPGIIEVMFARDDFCGIKCSYPKDYNDPYELFLSVDVGSSADLLATYREIVRELPQYPTTCFSKAPTVAPMWAHYAQNHTGFVLEFDTDALKKSFGDVRIEDVIYTHEPDPNIKVYLQRAAETKKPRHAMWLQGLVIQRAYHSKLPDWEYEQECRLVASNDDVEVVAGNMVLFAPVECLSAIIVGKDAAEDLVKATKTLAARYGVPWLREKIGRTTFFPYFAAEDGSIWTFREDRITKADNTCNACSEPMEKDDELCSWCKITDDEAYAAAAGNPLRLLKHFGMLDDYLKDFEAVKRKTLRRLSEGNLERGKPKNRHAENPM